MTKYVWKRNEKKILELKSVIEIKNGSTVD